MSKAHDIIKRIINWLNTGTAPTVFIKKILIISASILFIYRLGYVVGKLLYHIGS